MPYSPPSAEEWEAFLNDELGDAYVASLQALGKSYRIQQIKLIKSFSTLDDAKDKNTALVGACIYTLEKISQEIQYQYLYSSQKSQSYIKYYLGLGSTLATKLLTKGLKVTDENILDDRQKLVYLQDFHDLVKKHKSDISLSDINQIISGVVTKLDEDIQTLLKMQPTKKSLLKEFKNIPAQYEAKAKNNASYLSYIGIKKQDPARLNQLKMIELLSQHCSVDDYALLYGYLLYCMRSIPSASGELYLECKRVVNISDESVIPVNLRYVYYSKLADYVAEKILADKWAPLEKMGFDNPSTFFVKTRANLDMIRSEISQPDSKAVSSTYLNAITASATSCGLRILLGSAAIALKDVIVSGGGLFSYISIVDPEVALLATIIAGFVQQGMISTVASEIASSVNALVIYSATQPIVITYNSLAQLAAFGKSLLSNNKGMQGPSVLHDKQWVEALLKVDDSIFPAAKKAIVRHVIDFEQVVSQTVTDQEPSVLVVTPVR
jgi:hypothetical protein